MYGRRTIAAVLTLLTVAVLPASDRPPAAPPYAETTSYSESAAPEVTRVGSELPGTRWELASLRGRALVDGTEVTLEFGEDSYIGRATCNRYGGSFRANNHGSLGFLPPDTTAVGCHGAEAEQEEGYIEALSLATSYELRDGGLEIRDVAGTPILDFVQR